jgi:hypothetical protein
MRRRKAIAMYTAKLRLAPIQGKGSDPLRRCRTRECLRKEQSFDTEQLKATSSLSVGCDSQVIVNIACTDFYVVVQGARV